MLFRIFRIAEEREVFPSVRAAYGETSLRVTLHSAQGSIQPTFGEEQFPLNGRLRNPESGGCFQLAQITEMQENRSFDHYFGRLAGVRGFEDSKALKLPSGSSVFYQPDPQNPKGYLLPFHLDTRASSAQKIPSTSHAWAVQHEAWNGGRMDRWLQAHRKADGEHGPYVMGYCNRADIPFQFALAEAFTICEYHCSVMGPTWPNRMYWMTGMIDPEGLDGGPILNNKALQGGYTWSTYAEHLDFVNSTRVISGRGFQSSKQAPTALFR